MEKTDLSKILTLGNQDILQCVKEVQHWHWGLYVDKDICSVTRKKMNEMCHRKSIKTCPTSCSLWLRIPLTRSCKFLSRTLSSEPFTFLNAISSVRYELMYPGSKRLQLRQELSTHTLSNQNDGPITQDGWSQQEVTWFVDVGDMCALSRWDWTLWDKQKWGKWNTTRSGD